jgi:hypothetical protein
MAAWGSRLLLASVMGSSLGCATEPAAPRLRMPVEDAVALHLRVEHSVHMVASDRTRSTAPRPAARLRVRHEAVADGNAPRGLRFVVPGESRLGR